MREFHNMKQSIIGDDPLSREIINFKKKREQADMIEHIFRNIKTNYGKTDISSMKNNLDKVLSQKNPIYNMPIANAYFNRMKIDMSQKAFQSPEYVENKIINSFNIESGRAPPASQDRPKTVTLANQRPSQIVIHDDAPAFTGMVSNLSRNTPSRSERTTVGTVEGQVRRNPSPKQVSFDPNVVDHGSQKTGQIVRGTQPQTKVSPEKDEVQLNYKIVNPRLNHLKNVHLSNAGGPPITLKAFDNRNLAVGFADGTLKIVDIVASSVVKQYKFSSKVKTIESVSDNGNSGIQIGALVGLGAPDNAIVLLDLATSETAVTKFKGHTDEVSGICYLGNGDFVSCSHDGTVAYWSLKSTTAVNRMQVHNGKVNSMALLNNNTTLVTGGDDSSLQVMAINAGQITHRRSVKESAPVTRVSSFYGNSKFVFSCQQNGSIRIWNVETGEYAIVNIQMLERYHRSQIRDSRRIEAHVYFR
jgi:WD40 repeat protein